MRAEVEGLLGVHELAALGEPIEPWTAWLIRRVFAGEFQLIKKNPTHPFTGGTAFL